MDGWIGARVGGKFLRFPHFCPNHMVVFLAIRFKAASADADAVHLYVVGIPIKVRGKSIWVFWNDISTSIPSLIVIWMFTFGQGYISFSWNKSRDFFKGPLGP